MICIPISPQKPCLSRAFLANSVLCKSDYINPIDLCNRLNTYIIPEAAVHGFLTFLFLINGYWVALILNLPLLAWNIKKYVYLLARTPVARKVILDDTDLPVLGLWTTLTCWTQPRSSGNSTFIRG